MRQIESHSPISVRKIDVVVVYKIDRLKLRAKSHTSDSGITRGGLPFRVGHIYTLMRNRLYRCKIAFNIDSANEITLRVDFIARDVNFGL